MTGPTQISMFSLEGPPVSRSPSPASAKEWMIRVATWPSPFWRLLKDTARAGSSGRMSLASCHREKDGTLVPSLEGWKNSGMGGPTERLTLNTSEFPSAADVCSLSDVLEIADVPRRYFLSARACKGILRRAAKRGKELPTALEDALTQVSAKTVIPTSQP